MDKAKHAVLTALRAVVDPEVGLDVVTMGLVYAVEVRPDEIRLVVTLTSPGCPLGETILAMIQDSVSGVAGDRTLRVEVAWNPPWDPRMISPEGREALR